MARRLRFDLQSHSTSSDGELPPAEVVAAAAAAGVELLALSDHDTVAGVADALAAGEREGLRVVTAVEISALDDAAQAPRELHILGYLVDHDDDAFKSTLEDFLGDREQRTLRMRDALKELGLELDEAELDARIAAGKPIGRPHLAGAVLRSQSNAQRLAREHIEDVGDVIRAYLIEGKPAFRLRETPTVAQAVETIHTARGVAIWAHPFWDIADEEEVLETVRRFRQLGMDGVEAFYVTHDEQQTQSVFACCEELGMLSTGSADFHGPGNSQFSRFLAFGTYGLTPRLGPIAD